MLRPGLMLTVIRRYVSCTEAVLTNSKKNLQHLRKKTGFSFANCRSALNQFENDLTKAETWLQEQAQKEGWSKATKLRGRATAQGLIGVMTNGNSAALVEVNCETDFVAKNREFQCFVGQVASATLKHVAADAVDNAVKVSFTGDEMKSFSLEDKTLQDLTAMTIGKVRENMTLNRSLCMVAPNDHFIGTYVHSVLQAQGKAKCLVGKYGALITLKRTGEQSKGFRAEDLGRRLCQHIVGMSPLTIGEHKLPTSQTDTVDEAPAPATNETNNDQESTESRADPPTEMLLQEYLLDPSVTVGELVLQENLEIVHFARYECGESKAEAAS